MDEKEVISRLQSSTVRSALTLIVVNVLTLVTVFTGKALDIEAIKGAMELWLPIGINLLSVGLGWRAYKGRVNAEKKIEPLPWKDELKSLKKEK